MKQLFTFLFLLLCICLSVTVTGQKISGFLVDKDDESIDNEELEITIRVCKNQDSLFQVKDTVMTKDYGVFQTKNLKKYFDANPTKTSDTIRYEITYRYRTQEITTGKVVWDVTRISNQSINSDHALEADHAVSAGTLDGLDSSIPIGNSALITGNNENGDVKINTVPYPDEPGRYYFRLDENDHVAELELDRINELIEEVDPGSDPFSFRKDQDGKVETWHLWNNIEDDPGFYDFERKEDGSIGFKQDEFSRITGNVNFAGRFNVSRDDDGLIELLDAAMASLEDDWEPHMGTRNLAIRDDGYGFADPFLATPAFDTDPNGDKRFTGPAQFDNEFQSGPFFRTNHDFLYSAMGDGPFCAEDFFVGSPLLEKIEIEKSNSILSINNGLWNRESESVQKDFVNNLKESYPMLVREIDFTELNGTGKQVVVDYVSLVPVLSKAIKEQSEIIEKQQKEVKELKMLVEKLISESKK